MELFFKLFNLQFFKKEVKQQIKIKSNLFIKLNFINFF